LHARCGTWRCSEHARHRRRIRGISEAQLVWNDVPSIVQSGGELISFQHEIWDCAWMHMDGNDVAIMHDRYVTHRYHCFSARWNSRSFGSRVLTLSVNLWYLVMANAQWPMSRRWRYVGEQPHTPLSVTTTALSKIRNRILQYLADFSV
jgi:hypothetical protein